MHSQNKCRGRTIPQREIREGLKVHRSVKTRLEARGIGLSHTLSRAGEDTHVRVAVPHSSGEHTRKIEEDVYVPQVRPHWLMQDEAARMSHAEWDVDELEFWEWVD